MAEFKERYRAELKGNTEQIRLLKQELGKGAVTLSRPGACDC
jgi:uncharacterized protein YeaO (DUF488 family)